MKQSFITILFGILFIGFAGCASDHIIATNDGRLIDSETTPEINEETGMIEYEDEEGRKNQIPVDDVSEIKER
jgi:ABC-type enterochelin transport system ATPase subunit